MMIYILLEMHAYDPCPIMGVYTTPDLAKDQLSDADWIQNESGQWVGSRRISAWMEQEYLIESWEVDQTMVVPYGHQPLYLPSPEEVAAEVSSASQQFRATRVFSMGAAHSSYWPYLTAVATPAEGTPEYESMLKAIEINKTQIERYRKESPQSAEGNTDASDWKSHFDDLIKKVTEF